jgi:hypothetical protein
MIDSLLFNDIWETPETGRPVSGNSLWLFSIPSGEFRISIQNYVTIASYQIHYNLIFVSSHREQFAEEDIWTEEG